MTNHFVRRKAPQPKQPCDRAVRRGPEPDPPRLEFRGTSWKWYYRRLWHSLKLPYEMEEEARRRFKIVEARILEGRSPTYRPGEKRFKVHIAERLAHLKLVAVTNEQLNEVAGDETASEWW